MEINKIVIKAIKNLYKNARSKIKIGKFVSGEIKVEKGLRQGCSISPTLIKIFIHTALLNWNRKCSGMGVPIVDWSQDTIYTLLTADDQVLITQEHEDMEFIAKKLLEEYQKWGFKINLEKKNLHGLWSRNQRFNNGRSERLH